MSHHLIMFEGIPGSGKTTTAQRLENYYKEMWIETELYTEGTVNPVDLPFYAYLNNDEYEQLCSLYPHYAHLLSQIAVHEREYKLIPYKIPLTSSLPESLLHYLSTKECCYADKPTVNFQQFKTLFRRRFSHYVHHRLQSDRKHILESVLFQHQLHDIHRLYPEVDEDEIIAYILELATILKPMNPILFYIAQTSVAEALNYTASVRAKPHWASEEKIAYYIKRKNIELKIIEQMPFRTIVVNNSDRNWDKMFNTIVKCV